MGIIRKINGVGSYFLRNFFAPRIYNIRDKKILAYNKELRNKYAGKRCFVIGGGPSVAKLDLARLCDEYTFVVTEFDKNPAYGKLRPKFHLITDSAYYTEGEAEYWPKRFKEKSRDISIDTTIITNVAARTFVKKHGLFKDHQIYFIGTQGIFTDILPFNIGLDCYVPNPKNSVLMCLMTAAYMGFSPIYLLGCEHDFLSKNIGYGKSIVYNHSYEDELSKLDSKNDAIMKKYFSPKDLYITYEKNVANVLQLFRNYKFFYAKAKKLYPEIQIYNATPDSFLDVFPMINFKDIKF